MPNLEGLHLEETDIQFDRQGIAVDDYLQTGAPGIYAVGDVIHGPSSPTRPPMKPMSRPSIFLWAAMFKKSISQKFMGAVFGSGDRLERIYDGGRPEKQS